VCGKCGGRGRGPWFKDGGICYACNGADTRRATRATSLKVWAQSRRAEKARARRQAAKRERQAEARLERQRDWCEARGHGRLTFAELDDKRAREREERRQADAAASEHFGAPGDRLELDVTVVAIPSWERRAYAGPGYETVYCHVLKDDEGNVLVWKTTTRLLVPTTERDGVVSWDPEAEQGERLAAAGDRVRIRATVKDHGHRLGVAQTIVKRVSLREHLAAAA